MHPFLTVLVFSFFHLPRTARQLFGEAEDDGVELDEAEKQGENGKYVPRIDESDQMYDVIRPPSCPLPLAAAKEIETLRREAQAFAAVRQLLRTRTSNVTNGNGSHASLKHSSAARAAFDKACIPNLQKKCMCLQPNR